MRIRSKLTLTFLPLALITLVTLGSFAYFSSKHALTRQVLANLLDNALKYTPDGGLVTVRLSSRNQQVLIAIEDTGIGIAEQDRPLVFDRLYRADSSRSESGMGLGLSLVKAVVEAHQGYIDVRSDPENGTTFMLSFPIVEMAGSVA